MRVARIGAIVGIAVAGSAGPALAQEGSPADSSSAVLVYVESVLSSRFLFRGQAYSEGPVSQTAVWARLGRLSLYGWSNVRLGDDPHKRRLSEVDFGISYALDIGSWTIGPALDRYVYRTSEGDEEPPTVEASFRVSRETGPVTFFTEPNVDLQGAKGALFVLSGLGHEHPLGAKLDLTGSLYFGWGSARYNEAYVGVSKDAFHHIGLEVSLDHAFLGRLYLEYQFELTRILDYELRRGLGAGPTGRFGVLVGVDWN